MLINKVTQRNRRGLLTNRNIPPSTEKSVSIYDLFSLVSNVELAPPVADMCHHWSTISEITKVKYYSSNTDSDCPFGLFKLF